LKQGMLDAVNSVSEETMAAVVWNVGLRLEMVVDVIWCTYLQCVYVIVSLPSLRGTSAMVLCVVL
jgi:hypothetical protein